MSDCTATSLPTGQIGTREKIGLVLSAEDIGSIGNDILMSGTVQDDVILCLEGGEYWSNAIEELLGPEVSSGYARLSEDEWIALKAPIDFCLEVIATVDTQELDTQLKSSLEEGYVRAFFLLESGEVAAVDVCIEPSHAPSMHLN